MKKNKKKKQDEKQAKKHEKQDKKTIDTDEYLNWMINKETRKSRNISNIF